MKISKWKKPHPRGGEGGWGFQKKENEEDHLLRDLTNAAIATTATTTTTTMITLVAMGRTSFPDVGLQERLPCTHEVGPAPDDPPCLSDGYSLLHPC